MSETPTTAAGLLAAVETVWRNYREQGPGKVSAALYDDVESAANTALNEADRDAKLADAAETLRDLCHRCCCRSEGLCFVTGEAGLIPRRDLHERFEAALATLRAAVGRQQ